MASDEHREEDFAVARQQEPDNVGDKARRDRPAKTTMNTSRTGV